MKQKIIRLTEQDLHQIVNESVNQIMIEEGVWQTIKDYATKGYNAIKNVPWGQITDAAHNSWLMPKTMRDSYQEFYNKRLSDDLKNGKYIDPSIINDECARVVNVAMEELETAYKNEDIKAYNKAKKKLLTSYTLYARRTINNVYALAVKNGKTKVEACEEAIEKANSLATQIVSKTAMASETQKIVFALQHQAYKTAEGDFSKKLQQYKNFHKQITKNTSFK